MVLREHHHQQGLLTCLEDVSKAAVRRRPKELLNIQFSCSGSALLA
jgi:hypothetical protein